MAALTDEEVLGVAIALHSYFDSDDEKDIDERPRKRQYFLRPWPFRPCSCNLGFVDSTSKENLPNNL